MNKIRKNHIVAVVTAAITMGIAGGSAMAGGALGIDFDSTNFDSSMTTISNPYWPLSPDGSARTFTYVGDSEDGCVINTISIVPTDIKIDFGGLYTSIDAQVVEDREWLVELEDEDECEVDTPKNDEENLTELTFDWYTQDRNGNIWYMGERSQSFEDDCPAYPGLGAPEDCFEGSWEAGVPGPEEGLVAEPGIVVPSDTPYGMDTGDPLTPGTYYMQEVAEGAEDMAKILKLSTSLSVEDGVEPGEYENCRKVKEWNPYEPGESVEHKWYCHDTDYLYGPGLVLIEGVGGGPTEVETLVEVSP